MTETNQEDVVALNRVRCICYLIQSKKNEVRALINSGSEVNAMTLGYALYLGLKVRLTNVRALKINNSTFKTFGMVLASF